MRQNKTIDTIEAPTGPGSALSSADLKVPVVQSQPPKNRLHYIDGLRATAALVVVFNHAYQHIWWNESPQGRIMGRIYPWLSLGHYAVVAFIVLSGFCLMRPVLLTGTLRGGAWEFYKGRALRILPAYWAALFFALLLIYTLIGQKHNIMFDISLPVSRTGILAHLLLINNFWGQPQMGEGGNPQINPVFWTIALEWQIYFLFPIIVMLWKRFSILTTLTVSLLSVLIAMKVTRHLDLFGLNMIGLNLIFYFYFVLGTCAAVLVFSEKRPRWATSRVFGPLALLLVFGFIPLYTYNLTGKLFFAVQTVECYVALMMVAILVSGAHGGLKPLAWKPLVNIGVYSYSVYLLHLPLIVLLTEYLILPLRGHITRTAEFLLLLGLALPLILLFSKAFSSVFENKKALARYWSIIARPFVRRKVTLS